MSKKKTKQYKEQTYEQNRLFNHYSNLALSTYVWEGLPEHLSGHVIEKFLFNHGECFFYNDEEYGLIALPCNGLYPNIFYEPTMVFINGFGKSYYKPVGEGVRIKNNEKSVPTFEHVKHYVDIIEEANRVMLLNLRQQKHPNLYIANNRELELSYRNMIENIEAGTQSLLIDRNMLGDDKNISVIPTQAPYIVDKLQTAVDELERKLLTTLGLNNVMLKRERLVSSEADSNNDILRRILFMGLKTRLDSVEQINKRFNLSVSCRIANDVLREVMDDGTSDHGIMGDIEE